MMYKQKNLSIEVLRGVVILLLIVEHVIGSTPEGGMRIEYPSFGRYLYLHSTYILIPLFTAISGYVYAMKNVEDIPFCRYVQNKFVRLIIPAYTVGLIYFLIQYLTPGTNDTKELSEIWRIFVYPYTYFWFLPSLFLVMMAQFLLDKYKLCANRISFAIWLVLALLLRTMTDTTLFQSVSNIFSFQGALAILPFFVVGVASNRFSAVLTGSKVKPIWWCCIVLSIVLTEYVWFVDYSFLNTLLYSIVRTVLVCGVIVLLLNTKFESAFLAKIGGYSYGIYLLHGFGTSAGRILLHRVGVTNDIVVFFSAFALALIGSIVAIVVIRKFKIANFLILGSKIR